LVILRYLSHDTPISGQVKYNFGYNSLCRNLHILFTASYNFSQLSALSIVRDSIVGPCYEQAPQDDAYKDLFGAFAHFQSNHFHTNIMRTTTRTFNVFGDEDGGVCGLGEAEVAEDDVVHVRGLSGGWRICSLEVTYAAPHTAILRP
jgi:hypothetical protein